MQKPQASQGNCNRKNVVAERSGALKRGAERSGATNRSPEADEAKRSGAEDDGGRSEAEAAPNEAKRREARGEGGGAGYFTYLGLCLRRWRITAENIMRLPDM